MFFFSLSILFVIEGCLGQDKVVEFKGVTMGTTYSVKVAHKSLFKKDHVKKQIEDILKKVNDKMSTYIKDSDISKFNNLKTSEDFPLDPWFYDVLKFSIELAKLTKGSYDPTLGPLVNLWGFGPTKKSFLPSDEEIAKTKSIVGYDKLTFKRSGSGWLVKKSEPKLHVDLSSSAKGYAVDKVTEFLIAEGLENFLVEIGGEIKAHGSKFEKNWIVAIEKPDPNQRAIHYLFSLKNMSIATSGSYRNFFKLESKTYSHTIDASTGKPVEHNMVSVTVLNESCMKADAFATALMALGPKKAKTFAEEQNLAVYFIYKKEESEASKVDDKPKFVTHMSQAFKVLNPVIN